MNFFWINFIFLNLFFGCSSYIDNIHRRLDDDGQSVQQKEEDKFEMFKGQKKTDKNPNINSAQVRQVLPTNKRQYDPNKRATIDDFRDDRSEGSLWSGTGQQNFLFSKNRNRKSGDIILIQVQGKLKKEIALELARATPTAKVQKNGQKDGGPEKPTTADPNANNPTNAAVKEENEDADKERIYDTISGVVSEEINKEHILVKGRKDVLYKNRKRLIEILLLVARRDIDEDDIIPSSKVIESSVSIIK